MAPRDPAEAMASHSDDCEVQFIKTVPPDSLEQRLKTLRDKVEELKRSFKGYNFDFNRQPASSTVNNESNAPVLSTPAAAPVVSEEPAPRERDVSQCVQLKQATVRRGGPLKRKIDLKLKEKKRIFDAEKKRKYFERIFGKQLRQARGVQVDLEDMRSLVADIPQLMNDGDKKICRAEYKKLLKLPPVMTTPKTPKT